jgi:hypothetical protein
MRTVKHKIKPLSTEQKVQLLALMRAYQFEKNYWSDQLLAGITDEINLKNLYTYKQIRDSKNLTKGNYHSQYHLPVRYCTIALKEAYDLHIRTYEAQIAFLKKEINNKIYQFKPSQTMKLVKDAMLGETVLQDNVVGVTAPLSENIAVATPKVVGGVETDALQQLAETLNTFKEFLYFATNSLFYNYKTFRTFEEDFYSKKFRKARIYQRINPILQDLLGKASKPTITTHGASETKQTVGKANEVNSVKKEVLTKEQAKELSKLLKLTSENDDQYKIEFDLLNYYCNCLVKAIVQFRNYKPIQSQINPTITLDGGCYQLYSKYDGEAKKNRWFLDIMSMENGKRIKGLELSGFNYAKKIMKHKKYPNLVLSFDRTDMTYYVHLTFPVKKSKRLKNKKKPKHKRSNKVKLYHHLNQNKKANEYCNTTAYSLMTMLTVGADFGLTENHTFSDGWVSGTQQGKILNHIANNTKNSVDSLQAISEKGFFGVEKNNQTGRRNHKNNAFNHNQLLDNINENYRKKQRKYNRFLQNYKYLLVNEIIEHFTSDSIYGCYTNATHDNPVKLVFESLDYVNLGRNKNQKRQINLIKGILTLLEEKIKRYNLPIEIQYVNPAYTSQNCPHCYFVARANRNSAEGNFRCQHCGFTAIDDVRYQWLTKVVQREQLPSEDDFIAACNIAERPSTVPNSMRLQLKDIKYLLMQKHESVKKSFLQNV